MRLGLRRITGASTPVPPTAFIDVPLDASGQERHRQDDDSQPHRMFTSEAYRPTGSWPTSIMVRSPAQIATVYASQSVTVSPPGRSRGSVCETGISARSIPQRATGYSPVGEAIRPLRAEGTSGSASRLPGRSHSPGHSLRGSTRRPPLRKATRSLAARCLPPAVQTVPGLRHAPCLIRGDRPTE